METTQEEKKNPLREIIDPFINLIKAPRALWGINLSYLIEGLTYFGVLGLLGGSIGSGIRMLILPSKNQ